MAYGLGEQLASDFSKVIFWNPKKPWKKQKTQWRGWHKKTKVRIERHRAKIDPECQPLYNCFKGWEF